MAPARRWTLAFLALSYGVGLLLVLAGSLDAEVRVAIGAPSPRDFSTARAARYVSQIRSRAERERAAAAVQAPLRLDTALEAARRKRAGAVLENIDQLRQSPETLEQRRAWLTGFPELAGMDEASLDLLVGPEDRRLPTEAWEAVRAEVPRVVGLIMRRYIRQEDLAQVRSGTGAVVDARLDATTARLASDLAAAFLVANHLPDAAALDTQRQAAREITAPVEVQVPAGSTLVRKGDLVTPETFEALSALGLLPRNLDPLRLLSVGLSLLAVLAVLGATLQHLNPSLFARPGALAFIALADLVFTAAARLAQGLHPLAIYTLPASAVAMTLAVVFSLGTGVVGALLLAATIGLVDGAGMGPALYVLLGGLAGAVIMVRVARLKAFLWAGLLLSLLNATMALAQALAAGMDAPGLVLAAGLGVAQALVATGLAALGILMVGSLFGVATPFHLYELMRPDHPLLRLLQIKAPGSYQHSVVLANLVEAAAEAVGADSLLARAGAYFHDVGKTARPAFFIENQLAGHSPHEGLEPADSARIIVAHVADGVALGRRHRLPERLLDFVREHHGRTRVEFFYRQALAQQRQAGEPVDEATYRYPGPSPRSRETAILMLADGAEASVRAAEAAGVDAIDAVVGRVFQARLEGGELDDSGLSLGDLQRVRAAFVETLRGMYHPRIRYPEGVQPQAETATEPADGPAATGEGRPAADPTAAEDASAGGKPGSLAPARGA